MAVWKVDFYDNSDDAAPSGSEDVEASSEDEAVGTVAEKMGTISQRADLTPRADLTRTVRLTRTVPSAGTASTMTSSTPMDAILISANRDYVDDAIKHLADHKELYWTVGFRINTAALSFPILGFMHVNGGQVEYRVTIDRIIPFDSSHYDESGLGALVKPEPWRQEWKNNVSPSQRRNTLVITRIDPFSYETTAFKKFEDGQPVMNAPQGYIRVRPPDCESPTPILVRQQPVAEKHIEEFVRHHLEEIEPGLTFVDRQLSTPAGRLDLLCKDATGTYVVVEIKRAQGTDQVVGQILRYMGWVREVKGTEVRGIIIVQSKDSSLSYAIKATTNVQIREFGMVFV